MEPVSELTLRRLAELPLDKDVLLVHPPADGLIATLASQRPGRVSVVTWDARTLEAAKRSLAGCVDLGFGSTAWLVGSVVPGSGPGGLGNPVDSACIVVFMPKARERLDLTLALLLPRLRPDALLILTGDNRSGAGSAAGRLARSGWTCAKGESARHSQWWTLRPPSEAMDGGGGGATQTLADSGAYWKHYSVGPAGGDLTVFSLPGVFSHGELDDGTALLLEALPEAIASCAAGRGPRRSGGNAGAGGADLRVLDFGCGAGVLSLWLLAADPDWRVDAVDIDILALLSTRRTVATLAAAEARLGLVHADGLESLRSTYDLIVTNPPFHYGQRQDLGITRQFIAACRDHLRPGAGLVLVANRFLPYPELLQARFGQCRVIAENTRFRVYLALHEAGSRREEGRRGEF